MDRNKVCAYDSEIVVVDREDKCGIKGGVYQPKQIPLWPRKYLFLKCDSVRRLYWKFGRFAGEPCDISVAVQQDTLVLKLVVYSIERAIMTCNQG